MEDIYTISVKIPKGLLSSDEVDCWLTKTFGKRNGTDQDRWRVRYCEYRFKNQSDAVLFVLSWL